MKKINLETALSGISYTIEEALAVAADMAIPALSVPPLPAV
ncbi:MAG: hypothetical protein ACR5LD_01225 [Symbiopectobacterium sp.]